MCHFLLEMCISGKKHETLLGGGGGGGGEYSNFKNYGNHDVTPTVPSQKN